MRANTKFDTRTAISKINTHGALLVFPIKNSETPQSLWFELLPGRKMRWEWDADGDDNVSNMWMLMKKLSANRKVVYSKWYQGRATFFSRDLFTALLSILQNQESLTSKLSNPARNLLEILESDSPLSTRELKKLAELQGKDNEPIYTRAMKELFSKMLIVACGEVDDGAFPSLAVGSTQSTYEDLWMEAKKMKAAEAAAIVDKYMPPSSKFKKFFERT